MVSVTITCDKCGHSGTIGWEGTEGTEEAASDAGWVFAPEDGLSGQALCGECAEEEEEEAQS